MFSGSFFERRANFTEQEIAIAEPTAPDRQETDVFPLRTDVRKIHFRTSKAYERTSNHIHDLIMRYSRTIKVRVLNRQVSRVRRVLNYLIGFLKVNIML